MAERIAIPQCCAVHRTAALDVMAGVFGDDAGCAVRNLMALGDSPAEAVAVVVGAYHEWLVSRLAHAVERGAELAAAEARR